MIAKPKSKIVSKKGLGAVARQVKTVLENLRQEKRATVLLLSGNLGAGKTTFVQMLAKSFSITSKVLSPTFEIGRAHV